MSRGRSGRRAALAAALSIALAGCAGPAPDPLPAPGRLDLFLLAGQSNMAGRGEVAPEDSVVHPRVWALDREGRWVPARDPIHFDKPIAGVGPGRAFGIAVAEARPGVHVGLVPVAVGGSSVVAWEPGAVHEQTGARPYDEALARARRAMRDGTLRGILWHQGESDANAARAPEYERRLRDLIRRFRADLDAPDLPFLIGQLGQFDDRPWTPLRLHVDSVHRAVAASVPGVHFVPSDGLAHKGDSVHFSAPAARELGRRFARVYLSAPPPAARR